jgi:hypothetical protein
VVRGGAFDDAPWSMRCAYRDKAAPPYPGRPCGFRVVLLPSSLPLMLWSLVLWPRGRVRGVLPSGRSLCDGSESLRPEVILY